MSLRLLSRIWMVISLVLLASCSEPSRKSAQLPTVPSTVTGFASEARSPQSDTSFVPDRIIVIVMENHSFDDIIGATDLSGNHLLAPFFTQIAQASGLSTLYFGVAHPSLPNYLSMIAGNSFGIHDDNASCYAVPRAPSRPCHGFTTKNLVDSLDAAGISWASYNQSMPHEGFLGAQYPSKGDGLYRQKHNPFMYFKDIATNKTRLTRIRTFGALMYTLNNKLLPRFSYIVPDECHDMHGSVPYCPGPNDALIEAGDSEVEHLVQAIIGSGSFTRRSLMFITFDEGDNNLGCCDSPPVQAGGHLPTIVIAGVPGVRLSAQPYNHYSLLATIETLWGLPKLGYTRDRNKVKPMLDLLPSK